MRSIPFLLGLLDPATPALVTAGDLGGPHGDAIRTWQGLGFVGREPGLHPVPGCPHCGEGVPYRAEGRLLCSACRSAIDPRELLAWPVRRDGFVTALAAHLGLSSGLRSIDGSLWELGTGRVDGRPMACFFHPGTPLTATAHTRLAAYRHTLVLGGMPPATRGGSGRWVPLADLFDEGGAFATVALADLVRDRGPVRFDPETGTLRVGATLAGEVPVGSREWAFLACLAAERDRFVPYADLKRAVLDQTRGSGETDEATFCQKLKSRIKERYAPRIDRLLVTTNKGDGYRLRGEA